MQLGAIETENESLKDKVATLSALLAAEQQKSEQLAATPPPTDRSLSAVEAQELAELRAAKEQLMSEGMSISKRLGAIEDINKKLRAETKALKASNESLATEHAATAERLIASQHRAKEMATRDKTIVELQKHVSTLTRDVTKSTNSMNLLKALVDTANLATLGALIGVSDAATQLAVLKADLDIALHEKRSLDSDCERLTKENEVLLHKNQTLERRVEDLEQVGEEFSSTIECLGMLKERVEEQEEEKQMYRDQVSDLAKQVAGLVDSKPSSPTASPVRHQLA
eukprot:Selendium_serpulae@DN5988_c1_g1_i4.p1